MSNSTKELQDDLELNKLVINLPINHSNNRTRCFTNLMCDNCKGAKALIKQRETEALQTYRDSLRKKVYELYSMDTTNTRMVVGKPDYSDGLNAGKQEAYSRVLKAIPLDALDKDHKTIDNT